MAQYVEKDTIKIGMSLYGFNSPDQTITEFVEDTLPSADVTEVVRCKNCAFYKPFLHKKNRKYCFKHDHVTMADDYCSFAERREDGEIH